MIYIITNNMKYENSLFYVRAPGFDMPAYLAIINAQRAAGAHPRLAEQPGGLEILATAPDIVWQDPEMQPDMEMDIKAFQRDYDVEGWKKVGLLEDLSRFKTSEKGTK